MGRPHPMALRERGVAFVEEGHSKREAARHFRVSPRFVNNKMILHRVDGSLEAKSHGRPCGSGKLADQHAWISQRLFENGDVRLDELCIELAGRGVSTHRSSIGRLLRGLSLSHKKAWRQVNSGVLIAKARRDPDCSGGRARVRPRICCRRRPPRGQSTFDLTIKRGGMNAIYDEMVRTKLEQQTASAVNPDRAVASA
jgi:transposase